MEDGDKCECGNAFEIISGGSAYICNNLNCPNNQMYERKGGVNE